MLTGFSIQYTVSPNILESILQMLDTQAFHGTLRKTVLNNAAFRSILPTDCALPQDLRIKLQLLDLANLIISSYMQLILYTQSEFKNSAATNGQSQHHLHSTPHLNNTSANAHLSNIIPKFMDLCTMAKEKVSVARWVDITAQFLMQAAAEEYHRYGNGSLETFNKCLSWEPKDNSQALAWKQASAKYVDCLKTQRRTLLDVHLETTSSEKSLRRLESTVVDFLLDLMRTLDPPVLVQLERGQLGGLSRAETEQLKNQVGLR